MTHIFDLGIVVSRSGTEAAGLRDLLLFLSMPHAPHHTKPRGVLLCSATAQPVPGSQRPVFFPCSPWSS